ncbi:MAG: butyrate kinase [Synergistales bacterium]|nr:butyrate kinase [Synergistales bacterium]
MTFQILSINPGSTSTKVAWFEDDKEIWKENVFHGVEDLAHFDHINEQLDFRIQQVMEAVNRKGSDIAELSAVVGRGGFTDPIPGGTYKVDEPMIARLFEGRPWQHAANLGASIAKAIADKVGIPSFIVDPVSVDESWDIVHFTGLPELPHCPAAHTLNVKAVIRRAAGKLDMDWKEFRAVVIHLGGGITVCAHQDGRMVDMPTANELGPYSPERSGGLPAGDLLCLIRSGKFSEAEMQKKLAGKGGLVGYLGTGDLRKVKEMIDNGDEQAALVYRGMVLQISKCIGAMATSLKGDVDALVFTGGMAKDGELIQLIEKKVGWIAPSLVFPGEFEMEALTEGALRVLRGEEEARDYTENINKDGRYWKCR